MNRTYTEKIDIKTGLSFVTLILAGVVSFYSARLAIADDISELRIKDTALTGTLDSTVDDVGELKDGVETLNAKVDTLLLDRGYDPQKVISKLKD